MSGGALFIYRLYKVEDRMEHCGTLACISLGVDISLSDFEFLKGGVN
jgi:hypothetical protein